MTRAAAALTLITLALPAVTAAQISVQQRRGRPPGVASSTPFHPVDVVGSVALEHGGSPSQPVRIMLACMGRLDHVGVTDRNGRFRFRFDSTIAEGHICNLSAALTGFSSTKVSMPSLTGTEGSINVGTIKLSDGRPGVISVTSAGAPKSARRNLKRARKLAARSKPKLDEALVELQAAVAEYDLYAEAWLELGGVLAKLERPIEALNAYGQGIRADPSFILSYRPAIRLARHEDALDLINLWCQDAVRVDPTLRNICSESASAGSAVPEH